MRLTTEQRGSMESYKGRDGVVPNIHTLRMATERKLKKDKGPVITNNANVITPPPPAATAPQANGQELANLEKCWRPEVSEKQDSERNLDIR